MMIKLPTIHICRPSHQYFYCVVICHKDDISLALCWNHTGLDIMLHHQGNIDILQIIGGVEPPLIMHQLTCNCNGVLKGIRICMRGFPNKSHGGIRVGEILD